MNAVNPAIEQNLSSRQQRWRRPLMITGPLLLLLVGGWFYINSGRFISTDNAQVKAHKVALSSEISGVVASRDVYENQPVKKGELLFKLDDAPFRINLDQAEAQLEEAATVIRAMQASYREKQSELDQARGDVAFAQRELDRQNKLASQKMVAEGQLDAAQHTRDNASQRVLSLLQELASLHASLGGSSDGPVQAHPKYQLALAARDRAALDLSRTQISAPFAGVASNVPLPGQYVSAGKPVISIVSDHHVWVIANFKETQISHLRPGQPVEIDIDSYPNAPWQGRVESIGQASGSEFAILPAQNATGNWVKVVQRIPVRIALQDDPGRPPLRAGMSATVTVDTGIDKR